MYIVWRVCIQQMYPGYSFHSYFGEKERPSNRYKIVRVKYKRKYISLVFTKLDSTAWDSTLESTMDSTLDSSHISKNIIAFNDNV